MQKTGFGRRDGRRDGGEEDRRRGIEDCAETGKKVEQSVYDNGGGMVGESSK